MESLGKLPRGSPSAGPAARPVGVTMKIATGAEQPTLACHQQPGIARSSCKVRQTEAGDDDQHAPADQVAGHALMVRYTAAGSTVSTAWR